MAESPTGGEAAPAIRPSKRPQGPWRKALIVAAAASLVALVWAGLVVIRTLMGQPVEAWASWGAAAVFSFISCGLIVGVVADALPSGRQETRLLARGRLHGGHRGTALAALRA